MDEELFNLQEACAALKIDKTVYLRIACRAIHQTANDLKNLTEAYQADNILEIQAIAHRLKGDYANLRIDCLSDVAKQLNDLAKEKYDKKAAGIFIDVIQQLFDKVKKFIEAQEG